MQPKPYLLPPEDPTKLAECRDGIMFATSVNSSHTEKHLPHEFFDQRREEGGAWVLDQPHNSVWMCSGYKSDYPYAHTFISVIRDKNGRYSLADYNLFVPESAERKEDTNYIYQDTAHCVSPDEWHDVVKELLEGLEAELPSLSPDAQKRVTDLLALFATGWRPVSHLSFNTSFQLLRALLVTGVGVVGVGEPCSLALEFNESLLKNASSSSPPKITSKAINGAQRAVSDAHGKCKYGDDTLWAMLQKQAKGRFAEFQKPLVFESFKENVAKLEKAGIFLDLKSIQLAMGRLDARYAGVISINILSQNKYEHWNKDLKRIKDSPKIDCLPEGRQIAILDEGIVPFTLWFDMPFTAFEPDSLRFFGEDASGPSAEPDKKYMLPEDLVPDGTSGPIGGWFWDLDLVQKGEENMRDFLIQDDPNHQQAGHGLGREKLDPMELYAIVVGASTNGIMYEQIIHEEAEKDEANEGA